MKTKDFIKMLQDEDPTGEGHIRMDGGIPKFVESKPGYYDGPYSYIDENGNYVTSRKGYKIDIYCEDIYEFVCNKYNGFDVDNLTKIKSKFIFDDDYDNKKKNDFLSTVEKYWTEYKEISDSGYKRSLDESIKNAKNGWRWYQNKEVDNKDINPNLHYYYTWKIYDKSGKEQSSNIFNTEGVLHSEQWEKIVSSDKEGYYEWVYVGDYLKRDKKINEILN